VSTSPDLTIRVLADFALRNDGEVGIHSGSIEAGGANAACLAYLLRSVVSELTADDAAAADGAVHVYVYCEGSAWSPATTTGLVKLPFLIHAVPSPGVGDRVCTTPPATPLGARWMCAATISPGRLFATSRELDSAGRPSVTWKDREAA